jgi:hypothetical protein
MARIRPLKWDEVPEEAQQIDGRDERLCGVVLNPTRGLGVPVLARLLIPSLPSCDRVNATKQEA